MDVQKKRSRLAKIMKYIGVILLTLLIILGTWVYLQLTVINWWGERESHSDYALAAIMEQALRQPSPFRVAPEEYAYAAKYDWLDLEPITEEEWMNIKCQSVQKYSRDYGFDQDTLDHMKCSNPMVFGGYPNKNSHSYRIFRTSINTMLSGIFDSPCIHIKFNEYVLNYPKILNNIIKIAEKPCNYLKGEGLTYNLYCNQSKEAWYEAEKSCVVINILDSEGYKKMQIRIPRQDNKHLYKDQEEWELKLKELVARTEKNKK